MIEVVITTLLLVLVLFLTVCISFTKRRELISIFSVVISLSIGFSLAYTNGVSVLYWVIPSFFLIDCIIFLYGFGGIDKQSTRVVSYKENLNFSSFMVFVFLCALVVLITAILNWTPNMQDALQTNKSLEFSLLDSSYPIVFFCILFLWPITVGCLQIVRFKR